MSRFLFGAMFVGALALAGSFSSEAQAQFGPGPFGGTTFPGATAGGNVGSFGSNPFGAGNGATTTSNGLPSSGQGGALSLPPNIKKVVSIDAHNMLLAEVIGADGKPQIIQLRVDHNYSGGMAKVFGGDVVPTLTFVTPGATAGFGGMGGASFGGGNFGGSAFGGFGGNPFGGTAGGNVFGFNPGGSGIGPNTTVTGSGIFAPGNR